MGGKCPPLVQEMTPLLEVKNLHASYSARTGEDCPALAGVNFDLSPGEILGVSANPAQARALLPLLSSVFCHPTDKFKRVQFSSKEKTFLRLLPMSSGKFAVHA